MLVQLWLLLPPFATQYNKLRMLYICTNLYSVNYVISTYKFSKFEHCNSNSNFTCVTLYQRGYTFNKRRLRNLEMDDSINDVDEIALWNFYVRILCTNFSSIHFYRNFRYFKTNSFCLITFLHEFLNTFSSSSN